MNGDDENNDSDSSEGKDDLPASSEDDDDSDGASEEDADFLLAKDEPSIKKPKSASKNKSKSASDDEGQQSKVSAKKSLLPGGYDPRHREPSYCNADRVSWWELMVLASHAHPSVSTMARTLLSGANVVYNGNPLSDLNLTAFLDKFMEKKPKQSSWHGGSQIEPTKQMDINNHLIGKEILSLAEEDVPPEDLVFHKFYTNKMSSKPKKKKKKKSADDEDADFFDDDEEVEGGDESDNEEIENLLDTAEPDSYDYGDLDNVAEEEDDDLIGDADMPSDLSGGEADDAIDDDDDDTDDIKIGDIEDASDVDFDEDEDEVDKRKPKQKRKRKSEKASPFASYEEYEHLMEEDGDESHRTGEKPAGKKHKSKKSKK